MGRLAVRDGLGGAVYREAQRAELTRWLQAYDEGGRSWQGGCRRMTRESGAGKVVWRRGGAGRGGVEGKDKGALKRPL